MKLCRAFFLTLFTLNIALADWEPLFNGKDLTGWSVQCLEKDKGKGYWKVEDDAIVCDTGGRKDHDYIWLTTDREFGNFELEFKVQTFEGIPGNSGVQVRSRYELGALDGRDWMHGPQMDIHPPAPWRTGLIYDETLGERRWIFPSLTNWKISPDHAAEGWRWVHAGGKMVGDEEGGKAWFKGDWNSIRIVCEGTRIRTRVNGIAVTDLDGAGLLDNEHHQKAKVGIKGHIALQMHGRNHLKIRFKDLKIKALP